MIKSQLGGQFADKHMFVAKNPDTAAHLNAVSHPKNVRPVITRGGVQFIVLGKGKLKRI